LRWKAWTTHLRIPTPANFKNVPPIGKAVRQFKVLRPHHPLRNAKTASVNDWSAILLRGRRFVSIDDRDAIWKSTIASAAAGAAFCQRPRLRLPGRPKARNRGGGNSAAPMRPAMNPRPAIRRWSMSAGSGSVIGQSPAGFLFCRNTPTTPTHPWPWLGLSFLYEAQRIKKKLAPIEALASM